MTVRWFRATLLGLAAVFTLLFTVIIPPALRRDGWDFWGGARDTFANSYAAGVSIDVLMTYAVLAVWVFYEARTAQVRRGWIALVLGLATGVTVGLAAYLLIRARQVEVRPERRQSLLSTAPSFPRAPCETLAHRPIHRPHPLRPQLRGVRAARRKARRAPPGASPPPRCPPAPVPASSRGSSSITPPSPSPAPGSRSSAARRCSCICARAGISRPRHEKHTPRLGPG